MLPFSISVELHAWTEVKDVPWQGRWRQHKETAEWMRTLLTHGGYALVDRHDNPYCAYCSEVVLARLLLGRAAAAAARGAARAATTSSRSG